MEVCAKKDEKICKAVRWHIAQLEELRPEEAESEYEFNSKNKFTDLEIAARRASQASRKRQEARGEAAAKELDDFLAEFERGQERQAAKDSSQDALDDFLEKVEKEPPPLSWRQCREERQAALKRELDDLLRAEEEVNVVVYAGASFRATILSFPSLHQGSGKPIWKSECELN